MTPETPRPVALVTGASRRAGIGAAVAIALARDGWDVATTFWRAYDGSMPWGSDLGDGEWLRDQLLRCGAKMTAIEADLMLSDSPVRIFDETERNVGPVTALILCHCESVASDIIGTTRGSFDRHLVVNVIAPWLLVREFSQRFAGPVGRGRIVALTSDHVAGNVPYGASKGAMDRIVLAAAEEFRGQGITANVINPGPTDTGWMTEAQITEFSRRTIGGRVGQPDDCARLVRWLCSEDGRWITGQLIHSNGGFR